jgi:hypothetical protein
MAALTQRLTQARKSVRGIALDLVTPALAGLGLLATAAAIVAAQDSPRTIRAWAIISTAVVLLAAAETGYALLFLRARRQGRRAVAAAAATLRVADLDAAAIKIAVAVLDWTEAERATYRDLVDQTPELALARVGMRRSLRGTGRVDAGMRTIADQLAAAGGLHAADVFLAALSTDLIGYRDWEPLTRWWRAADLKPILPLHPGRPGRPDTGGAAHLPRSS